MIFVFSFSFLVLFSPSPRRFLLFRELLRHFLYAIVTSKNMKWKAYFNNRKNCHDDHPKILFNNFTVKSPQEHSLSHTFSFRKICSKDINSQLKMKREKKANNARRHIKAEEGSHKNNLQLRNCRVNDIFSDEKRESQSQAQSVGIKDKRLNALGFKTSGRSRQISLLSN